MNIKISKFGKIKTANISVNGLTVIAGKNDTGKSTVGKAIYSVIKSITGFPQMYTQLIRTQAIMDIFSLLFELVRNHKGDSKDNNYALIENMRGEMLNSIIASGGKVTESLYNRVDSFMNIINSYVENVSIDTKMRENLDHISDLLKENVSDNDKFLKISSAVFSSNFLRTYNNSVTNESSELSFSLGSDELASLKFENNELSSGNLDVMKRANSFRDATLIESPLYLEDTHTSDIPFAQDLKKKINQAKDLFLLKNENTEILHQIDLILEKSRFNYDENDKIFTYTVDKDAKPLKIINIASGAKSLGLLYAFLKTGILLKDSLLILDEPENHLHPEWQIKFAKILVLMVQNDFNVLLTSHSPVFIHALMKYSKDLISSKSKINFYLSEKIPNTNYSTFKNVNSTINDIFENLNAPNDVLYME